jgi:dihydroorotase
MIEMFTVNPARILNLDRGTLKPGAPGDVTIFDTASSWTYDVNRSFSKSRNTPFHGRTFQGGPAATIVSGAVVWRRD